MKILVLDDDAMTSRSVARTLAVQGNDVVAERDPDAALEMVRSGEWFDLMLCDRRMPTMYGDDFITEVRDLLGADAPVLVLMTDHDDFTLGAGAADTVIVKPSAPAELRAVVTMTRDAKLLRTHAMTQRLTRLAMVAS